MRELNTRPSEFEIDSPYLIPQEDDKPMIAVVGENGNHVYFVIAKAVRQPYSKAELYVVSQRLTASDLSGLL
jgi:hypothetical protein